MRRITSLIAHTWKFFTGVTLIGAAQFCLVPLLLGLATRAVFNRLQADGPFWAGVAFFGCVALLEVGTNLGINQTWSGFCYETHTLLQRNVVAGILRGFGRVGLPMRPGDAISRLRDEPPSITMGSMDGIADLVGRGLFAVVGGAVMWSIDPVLTVAAFAPVVVSSALSDLLGSRSARYAEVARTSTSSLSGFLSDLVGSSLVVRVTGSQRHVVAQLDSLGEARRAYSVRDRLFAEIVNSMNFHLVHVGTGAVLLLGAGKIRTGRFSVGDFALFVVFLDQLTYLPAEIGRVITELKRSAVSISRLNALMPGDAPDAVVARAPIYVRSPMPPAPAPAPRIALRSLEVEGLTCLYPGSDRGVRDVSFSLERGTFTVIEGRVGSGKTTLVHALLGLLPLSHGSIRWNDVVVDDPATFLVPPHAAFTPQVPRLFSQSLRDNLVLGRPADPASVDRALYAAVMEQDLVTLDAGLDTLVGRRGVKLSGGQVQRAAAARMFVQDAELLVFDDVSSALDATTEAELWRRLLARRGEITCLVVSHSPVALRNADQVISLAGVTK